jgi:sodium transport system permease protein
MKTIRTVFAKEVIDNFRDRRTLVSALLMGPLFGPILFAFVINLSVSQSLDNADEALDLPVIGGEYAPNLVRFIESRNINVLQGPESRQAAIDAVGNGKHDVVTSVRTSPIWCPQPLRLFPTRRITRLNETRGGQPGRCRLTARNSPPCG